MYKFCSIEILIVIVTIYQCTKLTFKYNMIQIMAPQIHLICVNCFRSTVVLCWA
jgi:hypothetical protein